MRKIRVAFFADMLIENFDGAARTIYQIIQRIDRSRYEFFLLRVVLQAPIFPINIIWYPALKFPRMRIIRWPYPPLPFLR